MASTTEEAFRSQVNKTTLVCECCSPRPHLLGGPLCKVVIATGVKPVRMDNPSPRLVWPLLLLSAQPAGGRAHASSPKGRCFQEGVVTGQLRGRRLVALDPFPPWTGRQFVTTTDNCSGCGLAFPACAASANPTILGFKECSVYHHDKCSIYHRGKTFLCPSDSHASEEVSHFHLDDSCCACTAVWPGGSHSTQ